MTAQSKATLKGKFETGDTPTGSDYADLIDSALNTADTTAQTLSSDLTVPVLTATTVTANAVNASSATLTNLDVTNFAVTNLSAVTVTAGTVQADNVTVVSAVSAKNLYADTITVQTVSANNLWIGGARQPTEAFCMVYAEASGTTTFSAAGSWQRMIATTSAISGLALNVTQTTSIGFMLTVNANTSAVYRCDAAISMLAGGNSKVYQMGLAKNGTVLPQGRSTRKIGTGADVGMAGIMTSVVLTSGDTIEVVVRNRTDTTDFTVVDGTFNVTVI